MVCMHMALVLALSSTTTPFGPFASEKHPVVGQVATIPGAGAWEQPAPLQAEVQLEVAQQSIRRHRVGTNPLYLAYLGYRYFISPSDGPRCQHYPTCSHYGVLATRRHGPLGIIMTIDRLWQSGQPTAIRPYPVVRAYGTPRFYDPVEASDFWFTENEQ